MGGVGKGFLLSELCAQDLRSRIDNGLQRLARKLNEQLLVRRIQKHEPVDTLTHILGFRLYN